MLVLSRLALTNILLLLFTDLNGAKGRRELIAKGEKRLEEGTQLLLHASS